MTRDEARRRAVEAAANWLIYEDSLRCEVGAHFAQGAIAAYERAMADAGWRMVRDVAAIERLDANEEGLIDVLQEARRMHNLQAGAWNACRAAMMGEGDQ